MLVRELGLHRETVGKYLTEMAAKYRKQRDEKGYHDLETLLQALDQVESDCWSKKARKAHAPGAQ